MRSNEEMIALDKEFITDFLEEKLKLQICKIEEELEQ